MSEARDVCQEVIGTALPRQEPAKKTKSSWQRLVKAKLRLPILSELAVMTKRMR